MDWVRRNGFIIGFVLGHVIVYGAVTLIYKVL